MSLNAVINTIIRALIRQGTYSVGRAIGLGGIVLAVVVLLVMSQATGR